MSFSNMSCEELLKNLSQPEHEVPPEKLLYEQIRYVTQDIILPIIFGLGIMGNIFNLIVLTRKRFRGRMNLMEKSATLGLFGLAVSDLLFCLSGILFVFVTMSSDNRYGDSVATLLVIQYTNYYPAIMNTFLLISTWIVVYVSVERFIGVCYPFKAREIVSLKRTIISLVIIYVLSIVINVPNFMKWTLDKTFCTAECVCYLKNISWLFQGDFPMFYHILWGVIGTFVPLIILIYCNFNISLTILKSRHQEGAHHNRQTLDSALRATTILLCIVVLYLCLVCPSMVIKFTQKFLPETHDSGYRFRILEDITNLMQALNFAVNFVLYCAISRTFRKVFRQSVFCMRPRSGTISQGTDGIHFPLMTPPRTSKAKISINQPQS